MPIAIGDGSPRTNASSVINAEAKNETKIWLPTNAPTREITASVRRATLGRREAGTSLRAISVACGSEVMK